MNAIMESFIGFVHTPPGVIICFGVVVVIVGCVWDCIISRNRAP